VSAASRAVRAGAVALLALAAPAAFTRTVPPPAAPHAPASGHSGRLLAALGPSAFTPFSAKRNGRIGDYVLGVWPNEEAPRARTAADAFAARSSAYALPHGFVRVTREGAAARVSQHFLLGDFLTRDQAGVWPKYLVLDLRLVDKLELVIDSLRAAGHPVKGLHVMSGFRTPRYNALDLGSRSAISRHIYGDAADVYPDDDGDGRLDDLNGDGRVDLADGRILSDAVESVERRFPDLAGGLALYPATAAHGPFVHVDARGARARWGP
jgi:hypothetical protein